MNINILVFEGVDEIDFVGPLEIFRRAAKLTGKMDVHLVTLAPCAQVICAYGLRVLPDSVLEGTPDLLIVPGGGYAGRAARGIRYEIEHTALTACLAELHARGCLLAGVCTGGMALAAAGLLKNRKAVTHRAALAGLHASGAVVVKSRVVDDGELVTCGGVTSSLDLALHLVSRLCGPQVAAQISLGMEYTPSTDVVIGKSPADAS